jgi:uncharacterized protein (DUF433 family)
MANVNAKKPRRNPELKYVELRDGAYWIAGTRISLDSVVYPYREGRAPEDIVRSFPSLTLEYVYASITFYLAHQKKIDVYLEKRKAEFESQRIAARAKSPALQSKLARARRSVPSRS